MLARVTSFVREAPFFRSSLTMLVSRDNYASKNINQFVYEEKDGFLRLIYKLIEMLISLK